MVLPLKDANLVGQVVNTHYGTAFFRLPESSRWLYDVGKVEKAEKVIQYIARKNGHVTGTGTG